MKSKATWIIVLAALVLVFEFTYLFQSIGRSENTAHTVPVPTQAVTEAASEPATQPEPEAPAQADFGTVTPGMEKRLLISS